MHMEILIHRKNRKVNYFMGCCLSYREEQEGNMWKEKSKGKEKYEISQSSRAPLYALWISFCRSERYVL